MESYSGHITCEELLPNLKCIRVRKYFGGNFENLLHKHIPKHRLNQNDSIFLLKHLLAKYQDWNEEIIIESYLNKRKGEPKISHPIKITTEYPEPGVMRRYCDFKDVVVWLDEVVSPKDFRTK